MDDLGNKLNNVNAGCIIGSSLINHLMCADDTFIYGFINVIICVFRIWDRI